MIGSLSTQALTEMSNVVLRLGFIPTVTVITLLMCLLGLSSRSIASFSLLSLPGTLAHELMHLMFGVVTLAKPCDFSLIPRRYGNTYILGSVGFLRINVLNGVFVGLAPFALLPISIIVASKIAIPAFDEKEFGTWVVFSILAGNLLYSSIPSLGDIKIAAPSVMFYGVLFFLFNVYS